MSTSFNGRQGLVIIIVQVWGPTGDAHLQLAVDTGATNTLINTARLRSIGYDPTTAPDRVRMTTGSGVESVPRLTVNRIAALGVRRSNFPVIAHTLPPSTAIDGLLGLDFLRDRRLALDFRAGRITLR